MQPTLYFFFFNDTATTEIYTLSLHDALPIFRRRMWIRRHFSDVERRSHRQHRRRQERRSDRKSTRLNSSHVRISYAVFCLKKNDFVYISLTAIVCSSFTRCSLLHCQDRLYIV